MHCEKDRTCRSWRASVTQFSDSLVHNTVYEQAPTMCSNAYFKLVSHSIVNSHFPSDLYWFCTSLSVHTYSQVESARQAVSEVGIKYSLLSGLFYASKGWMQNCERAVWTCTNFVLEVYSSCRLSSWVFGMGCGINLILTLKKAVQVNVCVLTVYADTWPTHAPGTGCSCLMLKWCSFISHCQVPGSFCTASPGEVRTGIPQHSCKEQGGQMQALRTSQHCCQQSLALPVWQSRGEDLTDRSCSFLGEPSLDRTESTQVVTWQSHAGLTSAINRHHCGY